jgi:CheY-like chemotaxis protein
MKILIGTGMYNVSKLKLCSCLELYEKHEIDCVILDIVLPDMSGFELIQN